MDVNSVSGAIVDAAMRVHTALGPGLLESAYQACLAYELRERGHRVKEQVVMPVQYADVRIDVGYRVDLIVDDLVVVELKAVEAVTTIHEAQLITYLKLSRIKVGLLINFNVRHLKHGISRKVNNL